MSDKTPGKPNGKKPAKSLKEKRTAKKLKRNNETGPTPTTNRRHP
jgi:hypothetical protein